MRGPGHRGGPMGHHGHRGGFHGGPPRGGFYGGPRGFYGGRHMPPPRHHHHRGYYGGGCLGCCMYLVGMVAVIGILFAMIIL